MEINQKFYQEDIMYRPVAEQEKIKNYIESEEKDYEKIYQKEKTDDILFSLSNIRKNLLYAYDFKENAQVLEIGGHLGELTEVLCQKAKRVVTVETVKDRAEIIAKRCKDVKNLEVVLAKFKDLPYKEEFDYIIMFGILEYANQFYKGKNPALQLLNQVKKFLKKDGTILLATNNKFALKSFVGETDECTGIPFDSVTGYTSSKKEYKLSKTELEEMIKEAGFENSKFYYPLPDYKLANRVFTDEYLPTSSMISGYMPYYSKKSNVFFSELDSFKAILKKDKEMFPFFANSFMVEISKEKITTDIKYISYNNYRKEKYRLTTIIRSNIVEKRETSEFSKNHLKNMQNNMNKIEKENINNLDKIENDKIISEFRKEKLASQILIENRNNKKEIIGALEKYNQFMYSLAEPITKKEETIFKKYGIEVEEEILQKFQYLKNGYWDLILKNCFIAEENYLFFDQEWLEKNVPVEFMVYRNIVNIDEIREKQQEYELFHKFGIEEYLSLFEMLDAKIREEIIDETMFAFYIRKYKNPIYDIYNLENQVNEIAYVKKENEELKEILKEQKSELTEKEKQLQSIYHSRSWKIIRRLVNIEKKITDKK